MTAVLMTLIVLSGVPEVYDLPRISDSCDVIVVMLEDGAVPEYPWDGITEYQREELWTFGCRGLMVERMGWSGYIILTPPGAGTEILETAGILADPVSTTPGGEAARWMDMDPVSGSGAVILHFSSNGTDTPPTELPLKSSGWLAGPEDTLMVQPTPARSTFLWTELPDSISLAHSAWRGTGTELVPVGEASVRLVFSMSLGSVPSNLNAVRSEPHPLDDSFMSGWGAAFAAVDSLISNIHPVVEDTGHLLWLRGGADSGVMPFSISTAPQPPASVLYEMTVPEGWTGISMPRQGDASQVPGVEMATLPGRLSDPGNGELMATVIERMMMQSVIPALGIDMSFDVEHDGAGKVTVWIMGQYGEELPAGTAGAVLDALKDASLVPPGVRLLGNAAVRTTLMTGMVVDPPAPNMVAGELLRLTGSDMIN